MPLPGYDPIVTQCFTDACYMANYMENIETLQLYGPPSMQKAIAESSYCQGNPRPVEQSGRMFP